MPYTLPLFLFMDEIHAQVTIGLGLAEVLIQVSKIDYLVELGMRI